MWQLQTIIPTKTTAPIIPFQWIWARLVLSDVKGYKQVHILVV
jgi:hypothetical protein